MASYKIALEASKLEGVVLFRIGFSDPAQNDQIFKDAQAILDELVAGETGGQLALLNGPASLPVAMVLAHHLGHRYAAIGVFDPKMGAYVVSASHDPKRPLGSLIPTSMV